MSKLNALDVLPGLKTNVTAALTGLLNIAAMFGWVEVSPEQIELINGTAMALIGLFLSMKVARATG